MDTLMRDFLKVSYFSDIKITRNNIYKNLLYAAKEYAKGNLIDLGCGTKPYETLFKPYIDSYFGVDHHPTADTNYGHETRADLYANCIDTKLRPESFDTLLSTQTLEHVYESQEFLNEGYRLLRKNGIAIFTVPFTWQTHAEPYDFYRFTRFGLEKLFIEAGFEIVSITPMEGAYATLKQTKMISIFGLPAKTLFGKVYKKIRNIILIPIMNWQALHLDKFFYNEKLCLNYLIIARKPSL